PLLEESERLSDVGVVLDAEDLDFHGPKVSAHPGGLVARAPERGRFENGRPTRPVPRPGSGARPPCAPGTDRPRSARTRAAPAHGSSPGDALLEFSRMGRRRLRWRGDRG